MVFMDFLTFNITYLVDHIDNYWEVNMFTIKFYTFIIELNITSITKHIVTGST